MIPLDSINIRFGGKSVLKKLSITKKTLEQAFSKTTSAALIRLLQKMFEKCALKFKMTRAISCLSPTQVSSLKPEFLKKIYNLLQEMFHDDRIIS